MPVRFRFLPQRVNLGLAAFLDDRAKARCLHFQEFHSNNVRPRRRENPRKKKSARELRQGGSDYRCCIPALAGFVSPQSIAPDGDKLFAKDRRRATVFSFLGALAGANASTSKSETERDQPNGMFDLIRYVSVLSTSADLAMWRLRLALFEESRCLREAGC